MRYSQYGGQLFSPVEITESVTRNKYTVIAATDFPFGNRSRNMNIRKRAVIKIIFCIKFITQAFKKHSFHLQAKV